MINQTLMNSKTTVADESKTVAPLRYACYQGMIQFTCYLRTHAPATSDDFLYARSVLSASEWIWDYTSIVNFPAI